MNTFKKNILDSIKYWKRPVKGYQSFEHNNASLTSSAASMLVPQLIETPLAPWP